MREDRLIKIAEHLEKGQLMHEEFHFAYINNGDIGANGCGTMGCALGEFPAIFSEEWEFDTVGHLLYANKYVVAPVIESAGFLGISKLAAEHLFLPKYQRTDLYGGRLLDRNATRRQVAKNIRAFIAKMKETEHESVQ